MKDYYAGLTEKEKAERLEKQRAGGFGDGEKISASASRRLQHISTPSLVI